MGAPDRAGSGLGQAEVPHLALGDQVADGAGDVLDGNVGVDAVLVEEVDRLDAEPARASPRRRGGSARAASRSPCIRPSTMFQPNFVATTTRSGSGAIASPTSRSLSYGPVDLGGVDEGDPVLDGVPQHADHVVAVAGLGP